MFIELYSQQDIISPDYLNSDEHINTGMIIYIVVLLSEKCKLLQKQIAALIQHTKRLYFWQTAGS